MASVAALVEASLELPAFSTLDELATTIRAEVNAGIFTQIVERMGPRAAQRLQGLLTVEAPGGMSMFQRLEKPAQRATWSRFKAQAEYLAEVDALGDTGAWLAGVAPAKVTDFAGEAATQDIDTLSRYDPVKRLALVACLVHTARMRARDDLAEMLCKRVAANVKRARAELEEIRLRQRAVSERLIGTYRTVLEHLDPGGEQAGGRAPGEAEAAAVAAVERAGGFAAQLAGIEEVSAFHGDNYEVLVHRFFRKDRAVMFELAGLELVATTSDDSVLACLRHARQHWAARRDFIPLPPAAGGEDDAGIAFASANWRAAVTDRRHPGRVARRHFEAMVFTYLAEELRTGDIAVAGAGEYADWRASLLTWAECEPLLAGFCEKTGLPGTAAGFTERLRHAHLDAAAALDAGYEDNTNLVITENGVPSLKRRRSAGTPAAAENLAAAIARRMPERSLLSIVARTAYWLGWHHHFGPASGSDPKIADPLGRYCLAVFTGGTNIGPYEAARHIAGVSARELSMVRNRHIDLSKLNAAIASVVNAFAELDVVRAWGDGTAVAADGTQVETYIDNLLAETSIRYGGVGGIAYHYISDTYVALFSRFIPCGVWEAVHLIEGLLANTSEHQRDGHHPPVGGDPPDLGVADLGQHRVHHQQQPQRDRQAGAMDRDLVQRAVQARDQAAEQQPGGHRRPDPHRQEPVQPGQGRPSPAAAHPRRPPQRRSCRSWRWSPLHLRRVARGPAPRGGDVIAGQRHACRGRLRPQCGEPVTVEAVVDPAAPAGRGHQARGAQHAKVVGQQVRGHRHLLLQVAHAPAAPGQHPDDAQPHRVGQRAEAPCQFNRARCNNR